MDCNVASRRRRHFMGGKNGWKFERERRGVTSMPTYLGANVEPGEVLGDPGLPHLHLRKNLHGLDERGEGEPPEHDGGHERCHPLSC